MEPYYQFRRISKQPRKFATANQPRSASGANYRICRAISALLPDRLRRFIGGALHADRDRLSLFPFTSGSSAIGNSREKSNRSRIDFYSVGHGEIPSAVPWKLIIL